MIIRWCATAWPRSSISRPTWKWSRKPATGMRRSRSTSSTAPTSWCYLRMPKRDGVAVVQRVLETNPKACILIMTTYDGDEDIFQCLSQGAKGYLLKDAPRQEILSAIRAVSEDRPYTSSTVAAKALQRMAKPSLTQRELDVLQLVAEGRSNKDIARRLSITEGTAKTHVKAILTKLDAISRTEAVAVAHKRGLIHL